MALFSYQLSNRLPFVHPGYKYLVPEKYSTGQQPAVWNELASPKASLIEYLFISRLMNETVVRIYQRGIKNAGFGLQRHHYKTIRPGMKGNEIASVLGNSISGVNSFLQYRPGLVVHFFRVLCF